MNYSKHMLNVHGMKVDKGSSQNKIAIAAIVLIAVIGLGLGFSSIFKTTNTNPELQSSPNPELSSNENVGNSVRISLSEIGTSANWYTYNSNGVKVKYFSVIGSDDKYHLAADACDVCYGNKLGYKQMENVMSCNNCGRQFAINSIGTENLAGGCWPSYIPMKIDGNYLVVENSALDGKRFMFE